MTIFPLQNLIPLIDALVQELNIMAVLCYGSYAEGVQDEKSDIDLLIICHETIPSPELRNKLYKENHCENISLHKSFENWETSWTPINDEFEFKGKKIEIGYNISSWIQKVVDEIILEGKISLDDFQFRPYTFLGLLENAVCLYEKDGFISSLKKRISSFPSKLKEEIIKENISIFNESLAELEDYVDRDIGVLAFQFHLFRALDAAIQIIFALNEVYYPASKREENHLRSLPRLPQGFDALIYDLLPVFFTKKNEIIKKLKDIQVFIEKNGNANFI